MLAIHRSAIVSLKQRGHLAFERAGLSHEMQREVGVAKHCPARRSQQREADGWGPELNELKACSHRVGQRIRPRVRT